MTALPAMHSTLNRYCRPTTSSFVCQKLIPKPLCDLAAAKAKVFAFRPLAPPHLRSIHSSGRKIRLLSSAAAAEALADDTSPDDSISSSPPIKKLGVVVKPMDKPMLVLKFVWMEKNIGLALDQIIPGHGSIPLSPYYFWPRKDAWEELKVMLESRPWISQKQMIILLNQATDIINLWQQSVGD